jgi:tRNA pseudouridine38-40 synthase
MIERYRYKLTIEYEGTNYVGWQQQRNGPSVQTALQDAILNFSGTSVECMGAGRTDAGVHALGQVAHIDLPRAYPTDTIRDALNSHLRPAPIGVLCVEQVGQEFHARFSAVCRNYRYAIINRRTPLTVERGRAWLVSQELDEESMSDACRRLIGKHDFTSFRAAES